jgi:hypothetical protein
LILKLVKYLIEKFERQNHKNEFIKNHLKRISYIHIRMTMTTEQRTECWRELHQEYMSIMEQHEEDVDLNWTRDTHNFVMDRRLYYGYCRIQNLIYMKSLVKTTRGMKTLFTNGFRHPEVNKDRPFGFNKRQFNKIIKKYPRIEGSPELLTKSEILENIEAIMTITYNTINLINRRHLMCRNIAPETPQHRLLPPSNVERLQDILSELETEKEKISEGLYLRLCDKLMGLKVE